MAFDLGVAAMAFRLLAAIDHRQAKALGKEGGKGNAGRFTARHTVELLDTGLAHDSRRRKIHCRRADAREGDELAHIDVNRALHA
ncbi:hypothetical protein D3C72_1851930 [compost metagenome]